MNIVLVDSGQLSGMPEFPPVDLPKFAWLEYVDLTEDGVDDRCWRADVIVSSNTPVNEKVISETFKLKLLIAAGDKSDHIDLAAAKARGIPVCNIPGLTGDNPEDAQKIANQIIDTIHAWLDDKPINVID